VTVAAIFFVIGLGCLIGFVVGKDVTIGNVHVPATGERNGRIGMAVLGVVALGIGSVFLYLYLHPSNSSSIASGLPVGTDTPATQATAGANGTGTTTPPSSAAGNFTQEYHDRQFTTPGGGCPSLEPSSVNFTAQGPEVSTSPSFSDDIMLNCPGSVTGDIPAMYVSFSSNDQVAEVSGTPSAGACDGAVTQHPLSGNIDFAHLKPGLELCMVNSQTSQLTFVVLRSVNNSSGDLAWSATGWDLPANS